MKNSKTAVVTVGAILALFLALQGPVFADYGFAPSEKSGYGFTQSERNDHGFVKCSEPAAAGNAAPSMNYGTTSNAPVYQYPCYQYPCSYGYRDPGTYCHCPVHNNLPYRYYGCCQNNNYVNACNSNNGHVTNHRPATVIGVTYLLPDR
jgi:hypothetical protein